VCVCVCSVSLLYCVKRSTGHTHTYRQRTTPPTQAHTHTTRTTPQTPNEHLPQTLNNARRWRVCADLRYSVQVIPVTPVCMTFEDFYVGFTEDSHPAFTCTPTEGKMERRKGPPTEVTVRVKPTGRTGAPKI